MTALTGQQEHDSQDKTSRRGKQRQNTRDMAPGKDTGTGHLGQDNQDRTPTTGHPHQDNRDRTTVTGQPWQDNRDRTSGIGHPGQETRDRTPSTGHSGQDTSDRYTGQASERGHLGQGNWDRTGRTAMLLRIWIFTFLQSVVEVWTKKSCGTVIADFQSPTSSLPQLSARSGIGYIRLWNYLLTQN